MSRKYKFLDQQHNHHIELLSNKIIDQKLEYLHYNPVVAGYVESPEHWMYSSARNYYGFTLVP